MEEEIKTVLEKALKMNEQLKKRGKTLAEVSRAEFEEIADKLGMPLLDASTHRPN